MVPERTNRTKCAISKAQRYLLNKYIKAGEKHMDNKEKLLDLQIKALHMINGLLAVSYLVGLAWVAATIYSMVI